MLRSGTVFLLLLALPAWAADWLQWGGPTRDFRVPDTGLKAWPESGPRTAWTRALGEGYSAILAEGNRIYTVYRNGSREIVIAAYAASGKTVWEQGWTSTFRSDAPDLGHGPHATPLIVGDRLFVVSVAGRLMCLDKNSGKEIWAHGLISEMGGTPLVYGYASHPIAYRDTVIVPVGGRGQAMVAFRQSNGGAVWKRGDYRNAYSSPLLINVGGVDQLVIVMQDFVAAFNPLNGDPQWHAEHKAGYGLSVSAALWSAGNLLFVSSEYNAGGRVLELKREGNGVRSSQLWHNPRVRLHHGNAIRHGDLIYTISGGKGGPAFLTAIEVASGKIVIQDRSYGKASFLDLGAGRVMILTAEGELQLARLAADKIHVDARAQVAQSNAWTPPTLVGDRVYVRDRHSVIALDLAAAGAGPAVRKATRNR